MRPTFSVMIFSVCIIFGVFLINQTGIGGSEFGTLDVFEFLKIWAAVGAVFFTIGILVALALGGTTVVGSGPSPRIADAASWTAIGAAYTMMVGYVSAIFFGLNNTFPNLGNAVGGFFLIVVFVIFVLDLHESIQTGG